MRFLIITGLPLAGLNACDVDDDDDRFCAERCEHDVVDDGHCLDCGATAHEFILEPDFDMER